jgi:hypothetical protein
VEDSTVGLVHTGVSPDKVGQLIPGAGVRRGADDAEMEGDGAATDAGLASFNHASFNHASFNHASFI